jgi:hypothetical protein
LSCTLVSTVTAASIWSRALGRSEARRATPLEQIVRLWLDPTPAGPLRFVFFSRIQLLSVLAASVILFGMIFGPRAMCAGRSTSVMPEFPALRRQIPARGARPCVARPTRLGSGPHRRFSSADCFVRPLDCMRQKRTARGALQDPACTPVYRAELYFVRCSFFDSLCHVSPGAAQFLLEFAARFSC